MKIIALGDSFTQGFLVEDKVYTRQIEKAGISLLNLGVNGSTTADMAQRFKGLKDKEADYLLVFGGTNDFLQGVPVDFVIKNLKSILDLSAARKNILVLPPFIEE